MVSAGNVILTSGKKKTAIARANIRAGKGTFRVNGVPVTSLSNKWVKMRMMEPFSLIEEKYYTQLNVKVRVKGGGVAGQADAVRIAVARGIAEYFDSNEIRDLFTLFDKTLLSGDARRRESKKFGGRGARARFQKSYR